MIGSRILALDYGTKNIGLAFSDEMGITVQPLESLPNRGRKIIIPAIGAAAERCRASSILVGIPYNMDGTSGDAVERVNRFMSWIIRELPLPVEGFDERLSTTEALEIWHGMSARQKNRYRTVDSLAAALILERYLEEVIHLDR